MNVFISHSSADAAIAEEVCALIESKGKKCFIAPRDIRSGKEYAEELMNGIDNAEALVLLMSNSANQSPHVLREVERAVSKSIPVLVYKLEEVELSKSMEYFLMTHQWVNAKQKGDYSEILDFVYNRETASSVSGSGKKEAKKTNLKTWLVACGALLATILLVGGCIRIFNGGKDKQTVANTVEPGETITFGSYNGEAISWRVLHISEDGSEAVLIAENILTIKAYDAPEGGTYNNDGTTDYWGQNSAADTDMELQVQVRGNSGWSTSNIRTWLNSSDEVVTYNDQPPMPLAMSEHQNGYHNEAGFLYGFSDEELAAIVETELTTNGNALAEGEEITTTDKVFLLSKEELQWFEEAGMSMLAVPTQAAIDNDGSNWYAIEVQEYGIDEYYWWLREPVEGTSSKCYMVSNGYTEEVYREANVGAEGFGIRPAITVSLESDIFAE